MIDSSFSLSTFNWLIELLHWVSFLVLNRKHCFALWPPTSHSGQWQPGDHVCSKTTRRRKLLLLTRPNARRAACFARWFVEKQCHCNLEGYRWVTFSVYFLLTTIHFQILLAWDRLSFPPTFRWAWGPGPCAPSPRVMHRFASPGPRTDDASSRRCPPRRVVPSFGCSIFATTLCWLWTRWR